MAWTIMHSKYPAKARKAKAVTLIWKNVWILLGFLRIKFLLKLKHAMRVRLLTDYPKDRLLRVLFSCNNRKLSIESNCITQSITDWFLLHCWPTSKRFFSCHTNRCQNFRRRSCDFLTRRHLFRYRCFRACTSNRSKTFSLWATFRAEARSRTTNHHRENSNGLQTREKLCSRLEARGKFWRSSTSVPSHKTLLICHPCLSSNFSHSIRKLYLFSFHLSLHGKFTSSIWSRWNRTENLSNSRLRLLMICIR